MYAIYGNIYHQYTPNVSIYTIHGSYGFIVVISNKLVAFPTTASCAPSGLLFSTVSAKRSCGKLSARLPASTGGATRRLPPR